MIKFSELEQRKKSKWCKIYEYGLYKDKTIATMQAFRANRIEKVHGIHSIAQKCAIFFVHCSQPKTDYAS